MVTGAAGSYFSSRLTSDPFFKLSSATKSGTRAMPKPARAADIAWPANGAQAAAEALSNRLIAELKAADTIVIGAPMYNFGIPSTLKAWFDYVLRPGITFRYTEAGPIGLLEGKRAIVIESRGGYYSDGAAKALDLQEPHLKALLGFMGIKDATFIRAEKLAFGAEARQQALDGALTRLGQLLTENQYVRAA